MKSLSTLFVAPALLATLSCVAGCSSDDPPPSNAGGTGGAAGGSAGASAGASPVGTAGASPGFTMMKDLIQTSCYGSSCHDLSEQRLHLNVDDPAGLYTKLTTYTTTTCGKLVNTANPAESALVKVLQADCNGILRMPYGKCFAPTDPFYDESQCVPPQKIAQIQAWIAMGAPK